METIRIFVGTEMYGKKKGHCVLSVYNGDEYVRLPALKIESNYLSRHYLILSGLLSFLQEITKDKEYRKWRYVFYSDSDDVAFEYNEEYKQTKSFSKNTKDITLWKKIITIVENKKINLEIRGKSQISLVGKL